MKSTLILAAALCVAFALVAAGCTTPTAVNNANAAKPTASPTAANTNATPVANTNGKPAANANSNAANKDADADTNGIEGKLQQGKTESLILYVGAETGDYAAYCFANDSEDGRKILAACKDGEQCEVAGEIEPGTCKVPGLEADLSDQGRLTKVSSAKPLARKK